MWGKISFWLRWAAAAWAGGVAVVAILQQEQILPKTENFEPWVWAISLGVIGLDNIGTLAVRAVRRRKQDRKSRIRAALMGQFIFMANSRQVRFEELGGSVFVPGRLNWLRKRMGRTERLRRIERFRPSESPQKSGIAWTEATGTVGVAFRMQRGAYKNTHSIAKKYAGVELEPAQFERVSLAARDGFDMQQFNAIAGKYSEILAEPIWHLGKERKLLGVVTVDRAFDAEQDTFTPELDGNGFAKNLSTTAILIARILREPPAED